MGRTEGQDAVPMTVGQGFHGMGNQLDAAIDALVKSEAYLYEINMGATAIGTGITASPGYAEKCAARLAERHGAIASFERSYCCHFQHAGLCDVFWRIKKFLRYLIKDQ